MVKLEIKGLKGLDRQLANITKDLDKQLKDITKDIDRALTFK